jgi:hypothetical protein
MRSIDLIDTSEMNIFFDKIFLDECLYKYAWPYDIAVVMGCAMGSIEGSVESGAGPQVVSCMLRPEFDLRTKGNNEETKRSGRLVWLYANNIGKRKAKDVHIQTNIPASMVESRLWIEAEIVKDIRELPPEYPICIGVVGDQVPALEDGKGYWISFDYRGEDDMVYSHRYEIEL